MARDIGKIPPYSEEAEQSFLGALLIDSEAMIRVADRIDEDDFYFDKHRMIFSTMLDLYAKHEPIDLLSLGNRLDERSQLDTIGGRSYLAELTNIVPTSQNVVHYAGIIQRKPRSVDSSVPRHASRNSGISQPTKTWSLFWILPNRRCSLCRANS